MTRHIYGNGSKVQLSDAILQIARNNDNQSNDLGFYGEYGNSAGATRYAGLIYQPDSSNDDGVWKLFDRETDIDPAGLSGTAINPTIIDSELGRVDVSGVRIAKTSATATGNFTVTTDGGVSVTLTTQGSLDADVRSASITVTTARCLSTSVIVGTSSAHVDIHCHSVANGSFQFDYINRTGASIANNTNIVFNFAIL